ncbi:PIG-L deacetylase family protein [Paenibacillus sp. GCM10027628]|uniref:PIG-L deacetylase family protein n=1 Tax=Paenibacillus sp. GCM10027628 TaxID=3273413 RepID=UPI00362A81B7
MNKWNILLIVAHPDDETACGGTIAKLAGQGHEVAVAVATNGNKGTHDRTVTPERLASVRRAEMQEACSRLGVRGIHFLEYDDGTLAEAMDLKERIFRLIRLAKPDILITFDPWRKWEFHPDHRALGLLATEAAYLADGCWYYPEHLTEGIDPWKPREVYLFWSDEPNYAVDVSDVWERKWEAADAHTSQGSEGASFGQKYAAWLRSNDPDAFDHKKESFRKVYGTDLHI